MEFTKEQLMSSTEICDLLCIRKNTLHSRRWRRGVQIPVFRLGKRIFIRKTDFWKWFEKHVRMDV